MRRSNVRKQAHLLLLYMLDCVGCNLGFFAPQQITVLPELLLIQVCSQLLSFCFSSGCKAASSCSELSSALLWCCLAAEQLLLQSILLAGQLVSKLMLPPF